MKNRSVSVGRGVFATIAAVMASCACGDVVNGVWKGAENAFWTNANNWAGGVVPGRYATPDGAGGAVTNGSGCCTATFNDVAAGAATTIDLDGLLSVTNITVAGATSVFTFGTSSSQQIPIESGGRLVVNAGAKAPVLAGTLLYAANLNYSYWNPAKVGSVSIRPGITVVNNSSEELAINDIGPVTTVGSAAEIVNGKDTLASCLNTEVALYLEGTGSVRFQGARRPYSGSSYNLLHLYHQLVNPAQLTVASETFVREFQIPSGSSYGKALIEITESGCLRAGTAAVYAHFLNVLRETRIFGAGVLRSDIYRTSEKVNEVTRYFMLFAKNDIRAKLSIEAEVVADYMSGYAWAKIPGYSPGFDLGSQGASGEVEFLGETANTGVVWIAGATLKTPRVGADEEQVSFGKAKLLFCKSGRLLYSGSGETTTRTLVITNRMQGAFNKELAEAAPKAVLEQSGSGVWNVASPLSLAGCTEGATLVLANATATNAVFSGVLADGPDGTLSIEKTGTGTWTLTAANTYTGTTTVNGGTLDIAPGASIASSSGLVLGGGTVRFANGDETVFYALPAVTLASGTSTISVGANAEVSIAGISQGASGAKVNFVVPSKPVKISVAGLAEGDVPAYITVNGEATTYSATDGLAVPLGAGVALWKDPVDGDWSDETKWSGGEVPAADADVTFSVYGSNYAARVTAPVALEGSLSMGNPREGSVATVAVSNMLDVSKAAVSIGEGGRVLVGEGGTYRFDNSTLHDHTYSGDVMSIGAGGELAIDGGRAVFTNFAGRINVTGTVRLDSGMLELARIVHPKGNYNGLGDMRIGPGGRFVQTGGTGVFYTFVAGTCPITPKGGEVDVSGDALWQFRSGFWADGAEIAPRYQSGTGIMRFRENAVLDPYVRNSDVMVYLQPDAKNETCIIEFHDHAKIDAQRTASGTKLGNLFMGGMAGGRTILRLYSDAHHNSSYAPSGSASAGAVGYVVTVGDGLGYVEIEMTNGTFAAGVNGLRIGCKYQFSGTAATGVVHVAGGLLRSDSFGCMSPGWITPGKLGGDMVGSSTGVDAGWFYGRVAIDGDGAYENRHGHLFVGYGFAEGEWSQNGGTATVCSDKTYSITPSHKVGGVAVSAPKQYATNNVFVIGCAGGTGRFTQTGGEVLSNLRTFVGGATTNEMTIYQTYVEYYNKPLEDYSLRGYGDRHNATGYLGVLGGTFTAAQSIVVGQDGTGVVDIGPTGTLHAASIVLTNNAYTAAGDHAATLKFTFGEDGVGTATVTNLVIGAGAALTVDMTSYAHSKAKPSRFSLLRAANVEGAFDAANVTLLLDDASVASKTYIDRRADGIDVKIARGFALSFR